MTVSRKIVAVMLRARGEGGLKAPPRQDGAPIHHDIGQAQLSWCAVRMIGAAKLR
jgi:hypothetical protein